MSQVPMGLKRLLETIIIDELGEKGWDFTVRVEELIVNKEVRESHPSSRSPACWSLMPVGDSESTPAVSYCRGT